MLSTGVLLIAIGLAPFAIYFTLKRPLIFPFGLYVLMVPIDGVLGTTTTLTRIVALVTGVALLFNMVVTRRVLAPPKSWSAWALFVLLACLTTLWTIDADRTLFNITMLLQLFLFYTVVAVYPAERNDVRLLGAFVVASGTLISTWALAQYAQGVHTPEDRLSVSLNNVLIDPNHVAASLLLPIALAVGTLLETRDIRLRFLSAITTAIMVIAFFLTGSRGGLIALAIMLLYIAWRTRYRFQVLFLMAVAGLASLLQPTVWARFADKGLQGGSGRTFIWDTAKLALKDHWLIGAGYGAFPTAYNHELFATYQPIFQGWSRPAHNAFLSAAVEVGILGGALHLYAWWRTWSDSRGNVVIEASIVGLAVASFFLDVLIIKYIWLAFSMVVLVKNAADPKFLRGARRAPDSNGRAGIAARELSWRRRALVTPRGNRWS
jgi:O-antigen ligase